MRHAGGHTRYVRASDSEALIPNHISHGAGEDYVGLFDVMPMQIWAATGMCFGYDERKGFEAVVATVDVIAKLSRWAVERPHFLRLDEEVRWIERPPGRPVVALCWKRFALRPYHKRTRHRPGGYCRCRRLFLAGGKVEPDAYDCD